jgi:hypothetical protein
VVAIFSSFGLGEISPEMTKVVAKGYSNGVASNVQGLCKVDHSFKLQPA